MSNQVITVREAYDWITTELVSKKQLEQLVDFIHSKYHDKKVIELQLNKVRFINFVGVIQCSSVRYEILPKITVSNVENRKRLICMLSFMDYFPVSFFEQITVEKGQSDLFEALMRAFVTRTLAEFHKGIYKEFVLHQENIHMLKGKLELPQHIRQNAMNRTKVTCTFDEYSENNDVNQLIKAALYIVNKNTVSFELKTKVRACNVFLQHVDENYIPKNVQITRQNKRFKDILQFARLIVNQEQVYGKHGQNNSFALLFEMNMLFERYIYTALRKCVGFNKVSYQHNQKKLLRNLKTGYKAISLKPDFIIGDTIIDTKWKSYIYNNRHSYQQSDIYQMYAYINAYSSAQRCILLYPKLEQEITLPIWEVVGQNKTIEVNTVRIDTIKKTMDDLTFILKVNSLEN